MDNSPFRDTTDRELTENTQSFYHPSDVSEPVYFTGKFISISREKLAIFEMSDGRIRNYGRDQVKDLFPINPKIYIERTEQTLDWMRAKIKSDMPDKKW